MVDKAITEPVESNGRPDEVVGKESWMNYLKRNNSIISDLMCGQFKSRLDCPDCDKVSITYDPFLTISLPIPDIKIQEIEFFYVHDVSSKQPKKMSLKYNQHSDTIADLKKKLGLIFDRSKEEYMVATVSFTRKEKILTDDRKVYACEREMGRKHIFVYEIAKAVGAIPVQEKKEVHVTFFTKGNTPNGLKHITFVRNFFFLNNTSAQEVHQ